MTLRAEDVLAKTFSRKAFGGYNVSEVATFLKNISEELEESETTKEELTRKLKEQKALIQEWRSREDILKNVMLSAQHTADDMKKNARQQAEAIVEDAKQKADLIIQDARDSLKAAYQDLSDLKRIHIQLKNTLQAVLRSHQDLLDQDPIHSILPSSLSFKEGESMIEKKMAESLNQAAGKAGL